VHDLNFACPTITFLNARHSYCGAVTDATVCPPALPRSPSSPASTSTHGERSIGAAGAFGVPDRTFDLGGVDTGQAFSRA
jgi:hypothetical protein